MTAVLEEETFTGVLEIPGQQDIRWDKADDEQVAKACAAFNKTLVETKGAAANQDNERIRTFDPEAERIYMWNQLQGG